MSNIYKDNYEAYISKGYSVIPDKYGSKLPAISGWSDYCREMPSKVEIDRWLGIEKTNIAVTCGQASGIIALDFDCVDKKIIDMIEHMLPPSPVERVGSKGWARFFRYNGESSYSVKDNMGNIVLEVLSTGKKCTLPPSLHPNGLTYQWTGKSLAEVDKKDLPLLPPYLLSHIGSLIRSTSPKSELIGKNGVTKIVNGRNDALSSLCAKLIQQAVPVDKLLNELITFDRENHDIPLFTDHNEYNHTEAFTNCLSFYASHMETINGRRFREKKEYEIPITASAVNDAYKEEVLKKKDFQPENQGKVNAMLPRPMGIMGDVQDLILKNSFIKQPELAFGASLAFMAILVKRNVMFLNNAPNMYILNVAPSGAGKDAPQQMVKKILMEVNQSLIGAGDYVSDASLMDPLSHFPARLDIIDEASGLLKTVNKNGADYSSKMADILCELYTTSTSKFLGRQTAEGRKGERVRPHVSLLMSCTPRGLQDGLDIKSIEKGLLGRVLFFKGDSQREAERLRSFPWMSNDLKNKIMCWNNFKAPLTAFKIGNMEEEAVVDLKATKEADILLDNIFKEFNDMRMAESNDSIKLPIIARLFQQLCKVAMLHACSRTYNDIPNIDVQDVEFAKKTVLYCYKSFCETLTTTIHDSPYERDLNKFMCYIEERKGVSMRQLGNAIRGMGVNKRKQLVDDLIELGKIRAEYEGNKIMYYSCGESDD